ncbi:hypothetical protein K9M16_05095 [Candidatus Babeliales bacterium]|nr:hypothetical protein [Candidatus Babeliales bacterium]MCF7910398.1 hypothetical protein [Candidatus Pacearchaeota archaeon]
MLLKQEIINKIKDYFDLNVYETKVWLALLSKGIASAGEIAEMSRVPRSRTYDVLESLEKKGFAIVKLGKPVKYIGVKPKIIVEKIKNNVRKQALERVSSLAKIKSTPEFGELEKLYNQGINPVRREDLSLSLKGKSIISSHLKEIIQNAEKEVIICTDAEEMNSKFKLFQKTFEDLKNLKIKIKVALSGDKTLISELSNKFGVKVHPIDVEAKFFIVDRKQVLFYLLKDSQTDDIAIWLNSDFFAESFAMLFDKAISLK